MNSSWFRERIANWPAITVSAVSFILVYLIPPAWIRIIPGMNTYLAWLPHVVPGIQSSIQASHFYEIAAVYYPIVFLFSPLACLEVWLLHKKTERWFTNFYGAPWKNLALVCFCAISVCVLFWGCFLIGTGPIQIEAMPHNESLFFMALLGPVSAGAGFFLLFGITSRAVYSIIIRETYQ